MKRFPYKKYFSPSLYKELTSSGFTFDINNIGFIYIRINEGQVLYQFRENELTIDNIVNTCYRNLHNSSWCTKERDRNVRKLLMGILIPYTREKSINESLN